MRIFSFPNPCYYCTHVDLTEELDYIVCDISMDVGNPDCPYFKKEESTEVEERELPENFRSPFCQQCGATDDCLYCDFN